MGEGTGIPTGNVGGGIAGLGGIINSRHSDLVWRGLLDDDDGDDDDDDEQR